MIETVVIALRFTQYVAAVLALGLPLFLIHARGSAIARRARVLAVIGCALLAAAALTGVAVQTAMMAGDWSAATDAAALGYVAQFTGLGRANIARAALSILGAGFVIAAGRAAQPRPALLWWAVLVLAGAVASFAWSGHAAGGEGSLGLAHLVSDAIHALAAVVWLGSLGGFLLVLARWNAAELDVAAEALSAFATVGTLTVAVLVITGLINSIILVGIGGWNQIFASAWGQVLIAKLTLFSAMLALAAHNRFNLTPALHRALGTDGQSQAADRLRFSIGAESSAGVALLALVATLGVQMPPGAM